MAVTAQSTRQEVRAHPGGDLDVVLLDAAQRQSLVAVRSLGRHGLAVGAFDEMPAAAGFSRWCSARGLLPGPEEAVFGEALGGLLDRYAPEVVMAAHDGTIEALRATRAQLEQRTRLALAEEAALEIAVDKRLTFDLARSLDVDVPRGIDLREGDETRAAVAEVGLPVVAKPARSWVEHGGAARRLSGGLATSLAEAERLVEGLRAAGATVILQEWIPGGRESVINCFAHGEFAASFALRVLRTHPPLGGSSVVRESVAPESELVEPAQRLVRAAGLEGVSEVEFRRDARGRLVLMEINPRLPATVELAVRAGVDFPRLLYLWALDRPLPPAGPYRVGLRLRWLGGDLRWLAEAWRARGRPEITSARNATKTFVADFLRPAAYDYLHRDDLRPAAVAAARLIWQALHGPRRS